MPILYVLYNLSLLLPHPITPDADKIFLGFIDDVAHLVANRDITKNIEQIQKLGNEYLQWGTKHGALFDERKAQLMHFTHRTHANPGINFGEKFLSPKLELRWLGYWLDPKLNFNIHLRKVKEVGRRTVAQLRRLYKAYSGLGPGEAKHLVTAVLRSRILYGSVVWFTTTNFSKVLKKTHQLHADANRMILGAFKTSPIDLMAHDPNLTPFAIAAVRLHHLFFPKRMTAPDTHPTKMFIKHELQVKLRAHKSPISSLVRLEDFEPLHTHPCEIIHPFPAPPWETPVGELMNIDLNRDEAMKRVPDQVAEEENKGALVIFTDGSLCDKGGGSAAVSKIESRSLSCTAEDITNNELELLAIGLAVAHFKDNERRAEGHVKYTSLAVFSDSQIALQRTHDPLTPRAMQYLAKSIKRFLSELGNVPVRLYWTPGHEGIELNEKADEAAKKAASNESTSRLTPASLSKLLQIKPENFHLRTAKFSTGQKYLRTQPRKIADALTRLEKGEAATIFHLQSGHSPLNDYLKRFNHHATGRCDYCKIPETVAHFLIHCQQFKSQRSRFRKAIKEDELKVNTYSVPALLNNTKVYPLLAKFILDTGRFKFLKSYAKRKEGTKDTFRT